MITEFCDKYDMLPKGCRVLCAVSGGADSVCLLHVLKSLENERGIKVFAAHFEHGIRGEEALRDAEFTEKLCTEWGIPCTVGHGNVPEYAAANAMSEEEAARKLRYDFLYKTMRENGCDRIATAHNADDNAETVIFNLTRGSAGVRGIPPVRGEIIRPLLGTARSEIEAYLEKHAIAHIEDSTNALDDYSRNRLRHSVLPVLRELNPSVSLAMLKAAELSMRDEAYFTVEAESFIRRERRGNTLPLKALRTLPESVLSRVIRQMCPKSLELCHVDAVMALLNTTERKTLSLPGISVTAEQGQLSFGTAESVCFEEKELICGKSTPIPELGVEIIASETDFTQEINGLFNIYFFKSANICGRIICTRRRPGDKLRPRGRKCAKTLKQLFMEAGYTQQQRDSALVLRDEKGILAVIGLAADERTAAQKGDRVLRIEIRKKEHSNE